MVAAVLETFSLPFVQNGLAEILLLAVPCGLIGSWVVLRGLAFHSHAVGTATFPGLVLADGLGFAAALGAFGAAALFTVLAVLLGRSKRAGTDSVTALALAACLAAGVILASDVFASGANVDTLLFGSLLAIDGVDLGLAGGVAVLAVASSFFFGRHWLSRGFDDGASSLRSGSFLFDAALLAVVGATVIATLGAVGALLVSTLIVVPAATARLFTSRLLHLQAVSVALVVLEGVFGIWLSVETNAPPGATIAVTSGAVFLIALGLKSLSRRGVLRPVAVAAALLALIGFTAGCGKESSGGDGPTVAATTTQVGNLVEEVGGGKVDLTTILKPNADPHDYEPRPSDVKAVAEADLIFRSGGHLDQWTDQLIEDSGSSARVIDLSEDLPVRLYGDDDHSHEGEEHDHEGEEHDHEGEEFDPHWWQDPVNVAFASTRIELAMSEENPGAATYYKERTRRFRDQIRDLTAAARTCLNRIPVAERKIVTDHDAFSYFTNRFGIESVGTVIPALTTEAQPSAGDLADLEETIRDEKVNAIFPEESVSDALTDALAEDTGAVVGSSLYGDTLGPEGSAGESWLGALKSNVDAVVSGITGSDQGCFGGNQ